MITESQELPKGVSSLKLRCKVSGPEITNVCATIVSPDYDPAREMSDWSSLDFVVVDFAPVPGEGNEEQYAATYANFVVPGEYSVIVEAENMGGSATPMQVTIKVPEEQKPLSSDVNEDGVVDILDLAMVAKNFSLTGEDVTGDVNRDGQVNVLDLVLVARDFDGAMGAPPMDNTGMMGWIYGLLEIVPDRNENLELALKELRSLLPPVRTELIQNYPNPFNPETWIPFALSEEGDIRIRLYDLTGQLIRELDLGQMKSGVYLSKARAAYWDGRNSHGELVASGTYICELQAGKYRDTKLLVLLK
jgi:hypothetical protein